MSWALFRLNFWNDMDSLIDTLSGDDLVLSKKEFNKINYIYRPYPYIKFIAERLAAKKFRKLKTFKLKTISDDKYVFVIKFEKMNALEVVKMLFIDK